MLVEILKTVANAPQGVSLDELTKKLGQDAVVLDGALDLLVRKGKLIECSESGFCDSCPARALCMSRLGYSSAKGAQFRPVGGRNPQARRQPFETRRLVDKAVELLSSV